ncbi:hypothetical protein JL100_023940 [Skermanella mucosa]|uniref:hypothetical protein n=1 Tax=Skermanella mucosa TaxID=1789672 RepID=UPI00192A86DF|nr:hypothetical protein [Skermanella mucosa]UEM20099.1 hypothetical protein JL100_023940 [Skermanella mucosa]
MVDAIPASDTENRRYLSNTPEHPYIPYDTPSAYGRAHIGGDIGGDIDGGHDRRRSDGPGGISAVIRDHPVPFVMFAASAGILLAAWLGYRYQRDSRQGAGRTSRLYTDPDRHHTHVSGDMSDRPAGRSPDADRLVGMPGGGKSARDSASVLLGPDGEPLRGSAGGASGGATSVGWATPDGSASHSDTVSGEAADTLGQTRRENAPPGSSATTIRTQANPPIFDRP